MVEKSGSNLPIQEPIGETGAKITSVPLGHSSKKAESIFSETLGKNQSTSQILLNVGSRLRAQTHKALDHAGSFINNVKQKRYSLLEKALKFFSTEKSIQTIDSKDLKSSKTVNWKDFFNQTKAQAEKNLKSIVEDLTSVPGKLEKFRLQSALESIEKLPTVKSKEPQKVTTTPTAQNIEKENAKHIQIAYDVIGEILLNEKVFDQESLGIPEITREITFKGKQIDFTRTISSTGIITTKVKIEGRDYEINEHTSITNNQVTKEDFLNRGRLTIDTARKDANKIADEELKKEILKEIDELETELKNGVDDIFRDHKIESSDFLEQHFEELSKPLLKHLGQIYSKAESALKKGGQNYNLEIAEREFIKERGRPIIVNFFRKEIQGRQTPITFVGIHNPQGRITIPSSIQNLDIPANYVTSSGGFINDKGEVEIRYNTVRHARPIPIAIKNKELRYAYGTQIVKQTFADAAKGLPGGDSKDNPIELTLSATTLLTAKQGDVVRNRTKGIMGNWKGESETLQLHETSRLYQLYDNQTIQIDGKWIRPHIIHANFGVNPQGANEKIKGIATIPDHPLQNKLNAHALVNYKTRVDTAVGDLGKKFQFSPKLQDLEKRYLAAQENLSQEISQSKEKLDELYSKLATEHREASPKEEKRIESLREKINENQEKVYELATGLNQLQKREFLENEGKYLEILKGLKSNPEVDQKKVAILEVWLQAQSAIYHNVNKDVKTVLEVPVLLNDLNAKLETRNHSFCKSAEDRTGIVEVRGFARMMHEVIHGTPPPGPVRVDVKDPYNDYFMEAQNWAPARNNTKQNSDSDGLQISPKTVTPEMETTISAHKELASFAKGVPKAAKEF